MKPDVSPTLIPPGSFSDPVAVKFPTGEPVADVRIAGDQKLPVGNAGIWECTPGRFRRQVPQAEYSHFISGKGSFTSDAGSRVEFSAGDAIYFPANTEGEWNITETVRKAYLILT